MSNALELPAVAPAASARERKAIETDIPARLDRLPWSRFHILVVTALGVTWILDGLEVTIVGAIGPVLQSRETLGLSATQVGTTASAYVISGQGIITGSYGFQNGTPVNTPAPNNRNIQIGAKFIF